MDSDQDAYEQGVPTYSDYVRMDCDEMGHEWEYLERKPGEMYTGYCERCAKCGEIMQIVQ